MSYSGFREYICEYGHYTSIDCWDDQEKCNCGAKFKYRHSVDTTNGYGDHRDYLALQGCDYDDSYFDERAPKKEIGFTDIWHEDHYGNKYATKQLRFAPDSNVWMELNATS